MGEAAKCLPYIQRFLEGKRVLDLGCGDGKIVPWAVGVDDCSESAAAKPDVVSKAGLADQVALVGKLESRGLPGVGGWDVVFSSHFLEHLDNPILENLRWWFSLVKKGGVLVLYAPDERRYVYDPKTPTARNPAHKHYLVPEVVQWAFEQITGAKPVLCKDIDYSTIFVVERTQ